MRSNGLRTDTDAHFSRYRNKCKVQKSVQYVTMGCWCKFCIGGGKISMGQKRKID